MCLGGSHWNLNDMPIFLASDWDNPETAEKMSSRQDGLIRDPFTFIATMILLCNNSERGNSLGESELHSYLPGAPLRPDMATRKSERAKQVLSITWK